MDTSKNQRVMAERRTYQHSKLDQKVAIQGSEHKQRKGGLILKCVFSSQTSAVDGSQRLPVSHTNVKPPPISKAQLRQQIERLSPYKASGPDGIPNVVLQKSVNLIEDYLLQIYQAVIWTGAYVDAWREFTTIVLRKQGKPSYKDPKAYRPIALLSTLSKVFTAIIAKNVMRMVEKGRLLPDNHYEGRPGRMTTDAVHMLTDKIKKVWIKGKVVSILFLDVEGAFPNAVTDRLIHNLRKRRIPEAYVQVIWQILDGRCTKLRFDDFTSEIIQIDNGIGQGDPLSMILYILYNADLLDIAQSPEEESLGYVDNALVLAEAKNFYETVEIISEFMNREDRGFDW